MKLTANYEPRFADIRTGSKMTAAVMAVCRVLIAALLVPEVCHAHSDPFEAGRSRVGIAERDDLPWFRCVVGTGRKRPLRARCDHHAAFSHESRASGATT